MKLNIEVRFVERDENVKCVTKLNNMTFVCTKNIQYQADRVNGLKRAKQLAYLGCMIKIHGYVCRKLITK